MGQFTFLAGEVVLAISALVLLLVGAFSGAKSTSIVRYASIAAILIFGFSGVFLNGQGSAFDGAFISDKFSHYVKAMIGVAAASAVVCGSRHGCYGFCW
jgi:NADH-quinone oxidoreductase subunit N